MYKLTCKNKECSEVNKINYFKEALNTCFCGNCKQEVNVELMLENEINNVFDYDFVVSDDIGLE